MGLQAAGRSGLGRIYEVKSMKTRQGLFRRIYKNRLLYLLLLPTLAFYIIFKYIPIYGLQLAFKTFTYAKGINGSPWVGLKNFQYIFQQQSFWAALRNTVVISLLRLIFSFPAPILLALLINELRGRAFKRTLQVVYTFPHFLSWVVLSGIVLNLFSSSGAVNNLLVKAGLGKVNFLLNGSAFRSMLIYTGIWKEAGWGTIIYVATIAAIDASLFEAALIDGANRWQKIRYIIWPELLPVVVTMMIVRVGYLMDGGFDQVFNLYSSAVYSTSDILDTYVYRMTFQSNAGFGVSAAIGMFKGVTNCVLLLTANFIAHLAGQKGIS